MPIRIALSLIIAAVVAIAAAYGVTLVQGAMPAFAPWALAFGIGASMTGMCVLGAARSGKLSPVLLISFGLLFVVVTGSFWLALGLPAAEGAGGPLLLGLPRRTAIVLYGVGAVPMFLLPLLYALTFDSSTLTEADIARVKAARRPDAGEGHA